MSALYGAYRSDEHLSDRYRRHPRLPCLLWLLLPLVSVLLLLPDRLADVIVQDLIGLASGAVIIGYAYLQSVKVGLFGMVEYHDRGIGVEIDRLADVSTIPVHHVCLCINAMMMTLGLPWLSWYWDWSDQKIS